MGGLRGYTTQKDIVEAKHGKNHQMEFESVEEAMDWNHYEEYWNKLHPKDCEYCRGREQSSK